MEIPVPIPNTEVKHLIANGTMQFAVWESRTLPGYFAILITKAHYRKIAGFFFGVGVRLTIAWEHFFFFLGLFLTASAGLS